MKKRKTSKQLADLQTKRNALRRRILRWREIQLIYMPPVAVVLTTSTAPLLEDPDEITAAHSESLPLWFPSSLPAHLRSSTRSI